MSKVSHMAAEIGHIEVKRGENVQSKRYDRPKLDIQR